MERVLIKDTNRINKRIILTQVFLCICGFMFARVGIVNEFFTLGIAYLTCVYKDKRTRNWTTLFLVLGYISISISNFYVTNYLVITACIIIFRRFMDKTRIKFNIANQIVTLVGSIFVVKTFILIVTNFNITSFITIIVECFVAALLVLILTYGIDALLENKIYELTQKETVSMLFMFIVILCGMIDFYISVPIFIEIYFKDILVFMFLIAITYLGGINLGVTVSVVIGSMLTIIGYIPINLCLVYCVSVLFSGLFIPLGKIAVTLGIGLGQIVGYIIFNENIIDMPIMGAYFVAAIITMFIPPDYFGFASWFSTKREEQNEKEHLAHVQGIAVDRLVHFKEAFEKLGVSFNKEHFNTSTLNKAQVDTVIEETLNKMCDTCHLRSFCWEDDVVMMYNCSREMVYKGERNGKIVISDIPESFSNKCPSAESFASVLNYRLDITRQKIISKNKTIETKMLMSQQMEVVANSIDGIANEIENEIVFNKELERQAREALISVGIKVKDIILLEADGEFKALELYTKYCNKSDDIEFRIITSLENAIKLKLELKTHICGSPSGCYFKITKKRKFGVTAGAALCAKGKISGDVYSFMEIPNGKYLMALSDGMGSGELARTQSKITIEMLEEFMEAGLGAESSLKLINSTLVLRQENEVFSTIDVAIIDTTTGVVKILKAGAATTFVLRDHEVIAIESESLPVGIIKDAYIETHNVALESGDILIMVTDGLLSTTEDALGRQEAFKQFILDCQTKDPEQMANFLLNKSRSLLAGDYSDDMTVVVGCIYKKI
ncbi:SpoIIE family protein phosphatase [Candidatus Epulonipiscium viviparus]|uniref:Stage II sporulation phosphatase E n=1 Tax=Candidatus Epulonipiscium viviparus TaxID=420336 RepID=F6KDI7_9FIRM|nr:SpoIIE family protein phosphatase [Candidatus Epulopiscium viviparus]ADN44618.1 stage II sporulation phosphatase E [Candidatus Epulopiscium viviparus]